MKAFWLSATVLYMALLGAVSLKTPGDSPDKGGAYFIADVIHNAMHVPAYMILTFVLFFTLRTWNRGHVPSVRVPIKTRVVLMALGYGILMEILQGLTPRRDPSMLDVGLNLCGILLMLALLRVMAKRDIA